MKEKIYTIPVNEAFDQNCECPVCIMYSGLEKDAVEYTMGPSYMEDDIRAMTDEKGFCEKHLKAVYDCENRLGFALVMKTHLDKVITDIERLTGEPVKGKTLFKKVEAPSVSRYIDELEKKCFVCERIEKTFKRYIDTIIELYTRDEGFRKKYAECNGFCTRHYNILIKASLKKLTGNKAEEFVKETNRLYIDNMKRVRDDVEWFINKFDHKYANESWKNSRDSLPRAMIKDGSIIQED